MSWQTILKKDAILDKLINYVEPMLLEEAFLTGKKKLQLLYDYIDRNKEANDRFYEFIEENPTDDSGAKVDWDSILEPSSISDREQKIIDDFERTFGINKSLVEKLDPKEKKKIKKLLQSAQPSEFMGQEITQLSDLLTAMKGLDLVKNDKNMQKKFEKFDENNLDLVATASELRKDYETLYNQLRAEIYPKKKGKLE